MNNDVAKKWTAALRSGKYPQSTQRLAVKNDDGKIGYCCLGVLCELAHAEGIVSRNEQRQGDVLYGYTFGGQYSVLPQVVMEWAGIGSMSGEYGDDDDLTTLNDWGADFAQIADVIDAHVAEL